MLQSVFSLAYYWLQQIYYFDENILRYTYDLLCLSSVLLLQSVVVNKSSCFLIYILHIFAMKLI